MRDYWAYWFNTFERSPDSYFRLKTADESLASPTLMQLGSQNSGGKSVVEDVIELSMNRESIVHISQLTTRFGILHFHILARLITY